mgnify:CR=1 FL=1
MLASKHDCGLLTTQRPSLIRIWVRVWKFRCKMAVRFAPAANPRIHFSWRRGDLSIAATSTKFVIDNTGRNVVLVFGSSSFFAIWFRTAGFFTGFAALYRFSEHMGSISSRQPVYATCGTIADFSLSNLHLWCLGIRLHKCLCQPE